jgi:UDP-4-amino-4,6-dideoxy-N-acetyl-beta-L-altrosamine transaminase
VNTVSSIPVLKMSSFDKYLPYAKQIIDDVDVSAVVEVLRGDWLTTGPAVRDFEAALEGRVQARHALAVSSGTAALHIAALAADLGPGCCAIVPTITFVATANVVRFCGAEVIFADVEPDTGLMGPEQFEDAIMRAKRTDKEITAVFPVHLAGQCADPASIFEIAEREGIAVIEDACHAIGTQYSDVEGNIFEIGACAHSSMTIFSFHPAKTIAMGEGGAVTTNSEELNAKLEKLRNHGMERDAGSFVNPEMALSANGTANPWYYEMAEPGYNYRASDLHCALGSSQLAKLDKFVDVRRKAVDYYAEKISTLTPHVTPLRMNDSTRTSWHVFIALFDFEKLGVGRSQMMHRLRERNVGSQVLYIPVHLQPYYAERYPRTELPGASEYYRKCLCLPLHSAISESEIDLIINAVDKSLKNSTGATSHV